jgi:hypothetical protein
VASQKIIKIYDSQSVLTWFQANWKEFEAISHINERLAIVEAVTDKFGTAATILSDFVASLVPKNLTLPMSKIELFEMLDEYVEATETSYGDDYFQALTSFQGVEMAWYIFDDSYALAKPERVAFLIHEDWELPEEAAYEGFTPNAPFSILPQKGKKGGKIFMIFNTCYVEDNLETLEEALVVEGIRLPDLIDYLKELKIMESHPVELVVMSQLVNDFQVRDLDDMAEVLCYLPFNEVVENYSFTSEGYPFLHLHWQKLPSEDNDSDFRLSDHCLQVSNHFFDTLGDTFPEGTGLYNDLVIFDDLWAKANPELATSMLYFAASWDCLD